MRRKRFNRKPMSHWKKMMLIGTFVLGLLSLTFMLDQHKVFTLEQKTEEKKLSMSYLYFGNSSSYIEKIDQSGNSLQTVSPSYFDLNEDGSLKNNIDPKFVSEMKKRNIKIVPFLSNHWNREIGRAALSNKEGLVDELVAAINQYQLDGVHVDIENLTEGDRTEYVELMRLLWDKLSDEKEVSIAVAANPNGINKGWQGSYDYKELAKYSDYLMIMAYDESYYGSAPGPVASLTFVEKSVQYALKNVPADKIVLGIPFYGRYWPEGAKGGTGIDMKRVEELVSKYNGMKKFDETSKSAYAEFTVPNGENPSVYYWKLDPGKYKVWYENDESLKHKLRLVQKYDLLGTASWSLNSAPSAIWDFYTPWLNGEHYFFDVENDWAERDILTMFSNGWMIGTSEDNFSPNQPLTRAQATVVLVRALGLEQQQLEKSTSSSTTGYFSDVKTSHWAKKEIEIAYEHNLIKGIGDSQFAPDQTITRAEISALLARVINKKDSVTIASIRETAENPFYDISNHWAYNDITTLANLNIVRGVKENEFQPDSIVTRAQMAALMNRSSSLIIGE